MITQHTRDVITQRSGGVCELCGRNRATNIHHRRPRGMGGTKRNIHTPPWLLHLCGSGTTGCHGTIEANRELSYERGLLLRHHQHPATNPAWLYADYSPLTKRWYGGILLLLTEDGGYEPWGARGWRMEPATKDTPGAKPGPSS